MPALHFVCVHVFTPQCDIVMYSYVPWLADDEYYECGCKSFFPQVRDHHAK